MNIGDPSSKPDLDLVKNTTFLIDSGITYNLTK